MRHLLELVFGFGVVGVLVCANKLDARLCQGVEIHTRMVLERVDLVGLLQLGISSRG